MRWWETDVQRKITDDL